MADSYHIIDGKVVPYSGGRKCNDTDAWRDATPLELQLQEQLEEYERTTAAQEAEIEALRAEVERVTCELMDAITRADKLAEALALLPDEIAMVEHNPDDGPLMFCCGREVNDLGPRGLLITHDGGCWYARMRALRDHDQEGK